jgi:hypothetical protein
MRTVPAGAEDKDVLAIVHEWIGFLAADDYEQAQALLNHDKAEHEWSADLVKKVVSMYSPPGGAGPARVTPIEGAKAGDFEPTRMVNRRGAGEGRPEVIGEVHFDVPINGTWSDMTAMFLLREESGQLSLELYDMQVL